MLKRSATLVEMLVLVCPAVSLAVDNAKPISNFVGTWKADSKRNVGSYPQLRFRRATDGGLEELRGFEAQPLVHPVKFGTQPYAVDDGTATIAWKEIDTTHF